MKRLLATAAALLVAGTALADIGPPAGFKRITAEHKVTTAREFPEYAFYKVLAGTATEVKIDPKTPADVSGTGLGPMRSARLVAVPKDAAKKFDGEKAFLEAVAKNKVEGAIWAKDWFGGQLQVKEADTRKVAEIVHKIEKIDAKEGIVFEKEKADPNVPPPPPGCDADDEAAATPTAYAPKGGTWVAGVAGALAVVFGGLWVARRGRRDLA